MNPLLLAINPDYVDKIMSWRNVSFSKAGSLVKIAGFDRHNMLIDINSIFSFFPYGDIVDRTSSVAAPFNFKVVRPWTAPLGSDSLDQVMADRVKFYTDQNCHLDLFWSGGIDSTAMVVSFLTHSPDLAQLRLIYTPFSLYENRDFFEFVTKKFPNLQTLDISGDVYINNNFNGIVITGHGGDEFTASLDETFFDRIGGTIGLDQDWRDFFLKESGNHQLIDFCEEYFQKSGKPINTVLEARWWFYALNKSQVFAPRDMSFLLNQQDTSLDKFSAFFDCQEFESYMWHNTDKIIEPGGDYKTYKKFLRHYIYQFYNNLDFLNNTSKISSMQIQWYRLKKIELLGLQWICILEDASVIRTDNLPLLSKKEFTAKYSNSLDYLFNTPD
jgi:hypothetical protein